MMKKIFLLVLLVAVGFVFYSQGNFKMAQAEEKEAQGKAKSEAHPIWSLLSSHPDTVRRATELQQGQAPHCAAP